MTLENTAPESDLPELPDITIYMERLRAHAEGEPRERFRLGSPFALRTVDPRPDVFAGRTLQDVSRIGKRIYFPFKNSAAFRRSATRRS